VGPEPGRPARAQRDAPEFLLGAERLERLLDVVVLADRDAAADHRDVCLQRPLERLLGCGRLVGDALDGSDLGAGTSRKRRHRVGVRVADAAGNHRLVRPEQLVAGADHRERRSARAGDRGSADRDEDACLRRPDQRSRFDDGVAGDDVLAGAADVAAGRDCDLERDRAVRLLRLFEADHRVATLRQRRTGRNPDCLAGADLLRRRRAGARLVDDLERLR
jgi:hypothetical protein